MKIVSVTLAQDAARGNAVGALASVSKQVDKTILVRTSHGPLRKLTPLGDVSRHFPWCNDFGAARNYALDAATEEGADWALMIDSDERFQWNGENLRKTLVSAKVPVGFVFHASGTYAQPRVFKLPVKARYEEPVHEAIQCPEFFTFSKLRFTELEKTEDQKKQKHERDLAALNEHVKKHPSARWWYYLGQTLHILGRHEEAIIAYSQCVAFRGWNEEGAWACYRAAECYCTLKRFDEAIESAALGLSRHAGFGECAWIAAYASYWKGDMHQAIHWACIATNIGDRYRAGRITRIGFRNLEALYEKPWDVLHHAHTVLSNVAAAEHAVHERDLLSGLRQGSSERDLLSGLRQGSSTNGLSLPASKPVNRSRQPRQ